MKAILLSLFTVISLINVAQISEKGVPKSWEFESVSSEYETFDLVDYEKNEHGLSGSRNDESAPLRFAETYLLDKGTENDGVWEDLEDGSRVWRLGIKSEGAYSLNFTFSHFDIPNGASVFVYSPDKKHLLGAFTHRNIKTSRILPIAPISGDELVIEYNEPADADFEGLLQVSYVGHDFLGVFGDKDGQFGVSGDCNIDINCPDGNDYQTEKNAICRMVINNSELCTGALINNGKKDATPYVLSANHCINTQYIANNTVFVFNYESASCKGADGSVEHSISGADLVSTKNREQGFLDFTLLKLSALVPLAYEPYFLGWDSRDLNANSSVCIHHPWGDVKKISVDNDACEEDSYDGFGYDPNTFWKVLEWDAGMTQGGSSGSPLLNQNNRIVGSLSGGDAHNCDQDPVNDYYQKFSASFDRYDSDSMQLKHWLDPSNSGLQVMDGYKPGSSDDEIDKVILVGNFDVDDPLAFFTANEGGYVAGNNAFQDKKKAEYYDKILFGDRNAIQAVQIAFAYASGNDATNIEVEILDEKDGRPGDYLGSAFLDLGSIKQDADKDWSVFVFDAPVIINNSVFVSVVLPQNEGDTIAIMNIDTNVVEKNTAWELNYYDQWWPYSNPDFSWNMSVAHFMYLEIGQLVSINDNASLNNFIVYPNPSNGNFRVKSNQTNDLLSSCTVFDALGRMVYRSITSDFSVDELEVDVSAWNEGIYFVHLKTKQKLFVTKLIVE